MAKPKYSISIFGIVVIFIALLICCGSPSPKTIEVTRIVPHTVVVTQLVEVVITATPMPATLTPLPTSTPEASPTPSFQVWNSQQVINVFITAGLETADIRPVTKDDYGLAPMVAVEGTHFLIPSLCAECGARVFSFSTSEDLAMMKSYYDKLSEASALFFSWVFVRDNILVQINGDLPEATARKYESALNSMK